MKEIFLETRHDFQVCALLVVSYSVTSHCFGPGLLSWAFHENKREKWNGAFLLCLRLSKNTLDLFSLLHTLRNAEREWREAWEGGWEAFPTGISTISWQHGLDALEYCLLFSLILASNGDSHQRVLSLESPLLSRLKAYPDQGESCTSSSSPIFSTKLEALWYILVCILVWPGVPVSGNLRF